MTNTKKTKKFYFILLSALFFISLIFSGWRNLRRGIEIDGRFFYKISDTLYKANAKNQISLQKNENTADFTIILDGQQQSAHMQWENEDTITITYEDGTITNGSFSGSSFLDPSGMPVELSDVLATTDALTGSASIRKSHLSRAFCQIIWNQTEFQNTVWCVILGIILYLIGAAEFLFPDKLYLCLGRWAFRKEIELSDAGILAQRIFAVVSMILGLIGITGLFP